MKTTEKTILHEVNGYWVSNEGTKTKPNYHVWVPGITHSTCDSAYADLSLAVARCNYLARPKCPECGNKMLSVSGRYQCDCIFN